MTYDRLNWVIHLVLVISALALSGCVKVGSPNEPKSDADALKLVGITLAPPPTVKFRNFQSGMDDSMRMVIGFPKTQLSAFWTASPWNNEPKEHVQNGRINLGNYSPNIDLPEGKESDWKAFKSSKIGWWAIASLPGARYARVYIAMDQDPTQAVGYIFWFET